MAGDWDYTVRVYAPPNLGGHLLLETTHRGTASKDIELAVCRTRLARGEVGHVDVLDHAAGTTTVITGPGLTRATIGAQRGAGGVDGAS